MSDADARVAQRVLDPGARRAQASKSLSVVEHFTRTGAARPAAGARSLDSGCSSGVITRALATRFAYVSGVDVDRHALAPQQAGAGAQTAAAGFAPASAQVDVILCNQVYQYVSDLRPAGGLCTFSARNLYVVLARDNWLPLIAYRAPAPTTVQSVVCDYNTRVLSTPARHARRWRGSRRRCRRPSGSSRDAE